MKHNFNQVCPNKPVSRTKLSSAISAGWGRVAHAIGKGTFADKAEMTTKTIDRALVGPSLPDAENLFNSLVADKTALNEVLKLYGLTATPLYALEADDMRLVTDLSSAVAEYLHRISDGKRCHIDDAALAAMFRPIIPMMQAIVDAADRRVMA